jgi:hypothetical protein
MTVAQDSGMSEELAHLAIAGNDDETRERVAQLSQAKAEADRAREASEQARKAANARLGEAERAEIALERHKEQHQRWLDQSTRDLKLGQDDLIERAAQLAQREGAFQIDNLRRIAKQARRWLAAADELRDVGAG